MSKVFNKRFAIICAVVLVIVMLSVMLVACGEKGETGLSAYEIAVKNGFNGSETDWLNSLVGEKGNSTSSSTEKLAENLMSCVNIQATYTTLTGKEPGDYVSYGTGVIIEDNKETGSAYILTNYHVVYEAINTANVRRAITVYLYGSETDGMGIKATFIGGSANFDMAVLLVENSEIYKQSDANVCAFGDSDKITVGEDVRAIGNGQGEGIAVSSGIVSIDSLYINVDVANKERWLRTIRTDASINGGNSGGGLFNMSGELIGIVNAKIVDTEVEGMGYALPINDIKPLADKIVKEHKENGGVNSAIVHTLGLTYKIAESWAELDKENNTIKINESVIISEIERGEAADIAGLKVGDEVLSVRYAGKLMKIDRHYKLDYLMLSSNDGDEIEFIVNRGGTELTLKLIIGAGFILQ